MTPIFPDRLCWSSAIGNFIINFGTLDYLVFEFLESRLPPAEFAALKGESFGVRAGRTKGLLVSTGCPAGRKERIEELFRRLDAARDLRNHIAHGHLLGRQDGTGEKPVLTLSLPKNLDAAYSPDSRHLEYSELEASLTCLTELIAEFHQLLNHMGGEDENLQRTT